MDDMVKKQQRLPRGHDIGSGPGRPLMGRGEFWKGPFSLRNWHKQRYRGFRVHCLFGKGDWFGAARAQST